MWDTRARSLGHEIPQRRAWLPTAVFLPEEFHGQRSLMGYSPWDHKKLDTTEGLTYTSLPCWLSGKQSAWNAGDIRDMGSIPGSEDPLEEDVATHFSILPWEIPKKGNAKECSNCRTIVFISHASNVMLKILQARLQQY